MILGRLGYNSKKKGYTIAHFPLLILGGGAAGLYCAAHLKRPYALLEGNSHLGAKIAVSGGGKCNFSNEEMTSEHFRGDQNFIKNVLSHLSVSELEDFMTKGKVPFVVKKNHQHFCKTSAKDLVLALRAALPKAPLLLGKTVQKVDFSKGKFHIQTPKEHLTCDTLVVASGGLSYNQLGASGIGYEIAKHFGHTVYPLKAALVGFTVQPSEFWFKEVSGASTPAIISIAGKTFHDNVLFAHKGISGPAILNASLYWEKGAMEINFLPDFNLAKEYNSKKHISTILPLPKRVIMSYLRAHKMEDKPAFKLKAEERAILEKLYSYSFSPAGTFGFTRAEITKGGVATSEIDPLTMESTKQKGLYFIGEVLDVNGELGGYNIHFAFASGLACARGLNSQG